MTRLILALIALTFVVGAPLAASATQRPRRVNKHRMKTADEVLEAYDRVYVAEVVSKYEDIKKKTVTLKTLHRYKGKVSTRTTFMSPVGCKRLSSNEMGLPIAHTKKSPGVYLSPGEKVLVMWDGKNCGFTTPPHDHAMDLKSWRARRNANITSAAAESAARHLVHKISSQSMGRQFSCWDSTDFDPEEVAAADVVVAGKIVKVSGKRSTLQIDSVYVERPEAFSAAALPFERKSLTFDLLELFSRIDLEDRRVVVLAHTNHEGVLEVSDCATGVRSYDDRAFPSVLEGRVPVSAEQLSCASLRTMNEDATASRVVFHAMVQKSRRITDTTQRVTLSGIHVYKGEELPETLTVKTRSPFTTSSFPLFKSGREVLAFGSFNSAGEFEVNRCGATKHAPKPASFEVPATREDIFRCAAATAEKKDMDAADVVGVGRLVRVDGSQSPPVAEFVMSSFYKGAALSSEGRMLVQAPADVASFAHDLDTLLFLSATPTSGVFALTSCGVQGLADGLTPVMHGHEAVSYDPHAHKSSCAAAAPAAPSRAPLLYLFVLLGALAAGRVRRDEALGRPRRR